MGKYKSNYYKMLGLNNKVGLKFGGIINSFSQNRRFTAAVSEVPHFSSRWEGIRE
jgi:hypothetical protein